MIAAKKCSKCSEQKSLGEFYPNVRSKTGESWCKTCKNVQQKAWRKQNPHRTRASDWRKRGVNPDHAVAALLAHDGLCALCGTANPGTKKGWAVDHCHATGKVRGVLCIGCNTGLGGFKDNPVILRKAAEYIEGAPR